MAVATTTALAVAGLAVSAGGATMSFVQANKQKKLQQQAQRDADEAMAEARKRLDVNFYDQLAVQKEPYQLEREALLSAGAQAIQAGVEGQSRGVAPTAGRIMMAQNEAQAGQRTAMGKELTDLAKLSATEDSRLRDVNTQLDLEEVAGAQMAARDAQEARAAYMQQGMEGVQSALSQGIDMAPLYSGGSRAMKSAASKMTMTPDQQLAFRKAGGATDPTDISGLLKHEAGDFSGLGGMSNKDFKSFIQGLTPEQQKMIYENQQFKSNYNPFQF